MRASYRTDTKQLKHEYAEIVKELGGVATANDKLKRLQTIRKHLQDIHQGRLLSQRSEAEEQVTTLTLTAREDPVRTHINIRRTDSIDIIHA